MSADYMEEVYQELFVNYLGKLVHSYQPPTDGSTWTGMQARYKENGFDLYSIAVCNAMICSVECVKGTMDRLMIVNRDKPAGTRVASAQQPPEPDHQWQPPPPQLEQRQLPSQPQHFLDRQVWQESSPHQQWATSDIHGPKLQPQQGVAVQQQQGTFLAEQQHSALSDVSLSSSRYITTEAKTNERADEREAQIINLHRAVEATDSAEGSIANKAYAYIAGMASPEPTPAPVTFPTEPPVPDRSSMYISATIPKLQNTYPPKRAPEQLILQDRTSSYIV